MKGLKVFDDREIHSARAAKLRHLLDIERRSPAGWWIALACCQVAEARYSGRAERMVYWSRTRNH